uniref:Uncharacterized protein n=1 Tax=Anopheles atroparvus TaxID=41427 RepID=A0AAG5DAH3_ANOAO
MPVDVLRLLSLPVTDSRPIPFQVPSRVSFCKAGRRCLLSLSLSPLSISERLQHKAFPLRAHGQEVDQLLPDSFFDRSPWLRCCASAWSV